MKSIVFLLIVVSVTVAQQSRPQKNHQMLFDFRAEPKANSPKIPRATERSVLSKVFHKYLTDENKCREFDGGDASNYLEAARKAGQIVPSINGTATGSFTAAGQSEIAYLISVGECQASHADNYGSKRMAIFSGQQLIVNVDVDFMRDIQRKLDLNGDGINELLLTTGDMAQGTLMQTAALVSFQNGRHQVIQDFGFVVHDSCASGFPGSEAKASVLYVSDHAPGTMPKITQENYVANCSNTQRWRFHSRGKIEE